MKLNKHMENKGGNKWQQTGEINSTAELKNKKSKNAQRKVSVDV